MSWQLIAALVHGVLAVTQIPLVVLSRLPIIKWFISSFAQHFGRNPIGFFLRSCYWKANLKRLGQDTLFDQGVDIWGADRIEIGHHNFLSVNARLSCGRGERDLDSRIVMGDYAFVGPGALLAGSGRMIIGDFVAIMADTHLYSSTNTAYLPSKPGQLASMSHSAPLDRQNTMRAPVEIGQYAVIGASALILPGVTLGTGTVVHPFTQVNGSFPAFARVAGPGPGKQIGWRWPDKMHPH